MKAENKQISIGFKSGNTDPTLAAALDHSQGLQIVKELSAHPKAAAFNETGMGDIDWCFYPSLVGAER